jgi:hypothetical protein
MGKSRGVLRIPPAAGKFRMLRRSPPRDLAHCIATLLDGELGPAGREATCAGDPATSQYSCRV